MKWKLRIELALLLAGCLAATTGLSAQNSGQGTKAQQESAPPAASQQTNGNPFPEDEKSVPVMPSGNAPDIAPDAGAANSPEAAPPTDSDPVRSPEEAAPGIGSTGGFSSSRNGLDNLDTPPDDEPAGKNKKGDDSLLDTMPRETPKEDINVGNYYMDNKDWKGALSRFQSALVLAPDNPDVYWGLAECQRRLGQYAQARANYLKVMEYDPGSKHAKEAQKALKDPDLANAMPPAKPQN